MQTAMVRASCLPFPVPCTLYLLPGSDAQCAVPDSDAQCAVRPLIMLPHFTAEVGALVVKVYEA